MKTCIIYALLISVLPSTIRAYDETLPPNKEQEYRTIAAEFIDADEKGDFKTLYALLDQSIKESVPSIDQLMAFSGPPSGEFLSAKSRNVTAYTSINKNYPLLRSVRYAYMRENDNTCESSIILLIFRNGNWRVIYSDPSRLGPLFDMSLTKILLSIKANP